MDLTNVFSKLAAFSILAVSIAACGGQPNDQTGGAVETTTQQLVTTPTGPGPFACGTLTCDGTVTYCSETSGGPIGLPLRTACEPFPTRCGENHSCACFGRGPIGPIGVPGPVPPLPPFPPVLCSDTNGDVTVRLLTPLRADETAGSSASE